MNSEIFYDENVGEWEVFSFDKSITMIDKKAKLS